MTISFGSTESIDTSDNFAPIPVAVYNLRATSVGRSMTETKNGKGQYLKVEFEVVDGQHRGRKIWANYNLIHDNDKAVEIAKKEVINWTMACGLDRPRELTLDGIIALEGRTFQAKVGIEKSDQYDDRNKISRFITQPTPTPAGVPDPQPQSENPAPAAAGNPWD